MTEEHNQAQRDRLAKLIGQTAALMSTLSLIEDERCDMLLEKCVQRYARLMQAYIELDPELEALRKHETVVQYMEDSHFHGLQIIQDYGEITKLENVSPIRRHDLICIAFSLCSAHNHGFDSAFDATHFTSSAVLAAYRLGLEDGMRGFTISLTTKMGSD